MEIVEKQLGETPKAILNRPILSQFERPYYEAFHVLSRSRQWTMGTPVAIPLTEINAYLEIYYVFDEDERDEFVRIMIRLDTAYLKIVRNKRGNAN